MTILKLKVNTIVMHLDDTRCVAWEMNQCAPVWKDEIHGSRMTRYLVGERELEPDETLQRMKITGEALRGWFKRHEKHCLC